MNMLLTLSIGNISVLKTWVDAAYALHDDMRSHTGGTIMMGKGTLYGKCAKQRINVKSFTEAELVGASDPLPKLSGQRVSPKHRDTRLPTTNFYKTT
jgi:hypothetical protein